MHVGGKSSAWGGVPIFSQQSDLFFEFVLKVHSRRLDDRHFYHHSHRR